MSNVRAFESYPMKNVNRFHWIVLLGLVTLPAGLPVWGGEWEIEPRLSGTALYTDNAQLRSTDQKSDVVMQVRPGLSVRGVGARLTTAFDVNLDRRKALNGFANENQTRQFQAEAESEIWEDHVFLEGRAVSSQVNINNQGLVTFDNRLGGLENQTTVTSYSVTPSLEHRFGRWAEADLRSTYTSVSNERDQSVGGGQAFANSTSRTLEFNVDGGDRFGRVPWSLEAFRSTVDLDTGVSTEFRRTQLTVGYQLSRKWLFDVALGRESNEFASFQSTSGDIRLFGFEWTPNSRTTVDMSFGRRFFGRTMSADVAYERRFTRFNLNYSDQIQTTNQFFGNFNPTAAGDFSGIANLDPNQFNNVGVRTDTPTLNDNVFLMRRMSAEMAWAKRLNSASVRAFWMSREDQGGDATETLAGSADQTSLGLDANFGHELSRQTALDLGASWQGNTFERDNGTNTLIRFSAGLNHRLSEIFGLSLRINHLRRSGGGTVQQFAQDFVENSISLSTTVNF